jgi:MFS family permease
VGFTGFTVVMPFLPLYIRQLGVSDPGDIALWSGLTLGITPAIAAICAPLWGRIGDRFGNKLLVQRSLIAAIVVMTAMAYATRAWHLLALRTVMGLFAGWGPLTISMAALGAPPGRVAQAIGAVQTAHRMGPTLGPVIGGVLAPVVGLRHAFLVSAGLYVVAFIGITAFYRESDNAEGSAPHRTAASAAQPTSLASILAFENLVLLMVVIFGVQLVDRSFAPVLALYLAQLGYATDTIPLAAGVLFSVLAVAAAGGNQVAGRLLRSHSPRQVIAWSSLIAALALLLFIWTPSLGLLACELAVIGVCTGVSLTTAFSAGAAVIPRQAHNSAFGFLTGASLVAVALSPVLAGLVGAQGIRIVFMSGVAVLVALALVVRKLMVERANPRDVSYASGASRDA